MDQLEIWIPTYNGNFFPDEVAAHQIEEYGEPEVPVTIYQQSGLRVVLGTHEPDSDTEKPDLLIERQPNAWGVFIHPDGSDPSALLYILDDGRTYVVPEGYPAFSPLEVTSQLSEVPGLLPPKRTKSQSRFEARHRTQRLFPRAVRDLGVIGAAIRDAIKEIHRITSVEKLDPRSIERIIDKHISRLSRPIA